MLHVLRCLQNHQVENRVEDLFKKIRIIEFKKIRIDFAQRKNVGTLAESKSIQVNDVRSVPDGKCRNQRESKSSKTAPGSDGRIFPF
jgi:hypothetical protein